MCISFIKRLQFLDLFYEVRLFVVELLVLVAVIVKLAEEVDKLFAVAQQNVKNGPWLVGIGNKYLETNNKKLYDHFV